MPTAPRTFRDGHGVTIETGDRVLITGWGGGVRLDDVRVAGTVTGFARTRITVAWDKTYDPPKPNIDPAFVSVCRRDGTPGFQGNAR